MSKSQRHTNTTASPDKLTCTDFTDFGQCAQTDLVVFFSWSKIISNYLDVKFEEFKKDDNREFGLVQNVTIGVAVFNQFMGLRNRLVIAAEKFCREENSSPMLIPLMSKDMIKNSNQLTSCSS